MESIERYSNLSKGYGLLCVALKSCGLEIFDTGNCNKVYIILQFAIPFLIHMTAVYAIFNFASQGVMFGITYAFVFSCLLTLGIWYSTYHKRNQLRSLLIEFYKLEILLKKKNASRCSVINLGLLLSFLSTFISAVGLTVFLDESPVEFRVYYLMNNIFDEYPNQYLIGGAISQFTFLTLYALPALIAVLCCAIYCKCSDLFVPFLEDIKRLSLSVPNSYALENMEIIHQRLYKLTHQVQNVIGNISFLVLFSQMLSMFLGLGNYMTNRESLSVSQLCECVNSLILNPLLVVSLVQCGSKVSSQTAKTRYILQIIRSSLVRASRRDSKAVELVEVMLNTTFPNMSAGGFVNFRPGLTLSAFGSLFSYGLLILSTKDR